jgi:hypothetical protein
MKHPSRRVFEQEARNSDGQYLLKQTFATKYSIYLEFVVHTYFERQRVVRPDLKDGKTEWFLVSFPEVLSTIERIKLFMVRAFDDCGADRPLYNTRSRAALH